VGTARARANGCGRWARQRPAGPGGNIGSEGFASEAAFGTLAWHRRRAQRTEAMRVHERRRPGDVMRSIGRDGVLAGESV
jgi:hypothetical protein